MSQKSARSVDADRFIAVGVIAIGLIVICIAISPYVLWQAKHQDWLESSPEYFGWLTKVERFLYSFGLAYVVPVMTYGAIIFSGVAAYAWYSYFSLFGLPRVTLIRRFTTMIREWRGKREILLLTSVAIGFGAIWPYFRYGGVNPIMPIFLAFGLISVLSFLRPPVVLFLSASSKEHVNLQGSLSEPSFVAPFRIVSFLQIGDEESDKASDWMSFRVREGLPWQSRIFSAIADLPLVVIDIRDWTGPVAEEWHYIFEDPGNCGYKTLVVANRSEHGDLITFARTKAELRQSLAICEPEECNQFVRYVLAYRDRLPSQIRPMHHVLRQWRSVTVQSDDAPRIVFRSPILWPGDPIPETGISIHEIFRLKPPDDGLEHASDEADPFELVAGGAGFLLGSIAGLIGYRYMGDPNTFFVCLAALISGCFLASGFVWAYAYFAETRPTIVSLTYRALKFSCLVIGLLVGVFFFSPGIISFLAWGRETLRMTWLVGPTSTNVGGYILGTILGFSWVGITLQMVLEYVFVALRWLGSDDEDTDGTGPRFNPTLLDLKGMAFINGCFCWLIGHHYFADPSIWWSLCAAVICGASVTIALGQIHSYFVEQKPTILKATHDVLMWLCIIAGMLAGVFYISPNVISVLATATDSLELRGAIVRIALHVVGYTVGVLLGIFFAGIPYALVNQIFKALGYEEEENQEDNRNSTDDCQISCSNGSPHDGSDECEGDCLNEEDDADAPGQQDLGAPEEISYDDEDVRALEAAGDYRFGALLAALGNDGIPVPDDFEFEIDQERILFLLRASDAFDRDEKWRFLHALPNLSERLLRSIMDTLEEGFNQFQGLSPKHLGELREMEERLVDDWRELQMICRMEAQATPQDISGRWRILESDGDWQRSGSVEIVQRGNDLTGTIRTAEEHSDQDPVVVAWTVEGYANSCVAELSSLHVEHVIGDQSEQIHLVDRWSGVLVQPNQIVGRVADNEGKRWNFEMVRYASGDSLEV